MPFIQSKKNALHSIIFFEIFLVLFVLSSSLTNGNVAAWLTGGQLVVLIILFMPDSKHGVGEHVTVFNYAKKKREAQAKWDRMTEAERKVATKESWRDSGLFLLWFIVLLLSLLFVNDIWAPSIYPKLTQFFSYT